MNLSDMVFVFGSNLAGVHGAGAARFAHFSRNYPWSLGIGPAANCYAIPTKDCSLVTLPLIVIKRYIDQFIAFAELMEGADVQFQVTRIGCGYAGFKDNQIAPLFASASSNCWFDSAWSEWMTRSGLSRQYWGTHA